jgi:hypothetical protein
MRKSLFAMLAVAASVGLSGLAAAPANAMEPGRHGAGAAPHGSSIQVRHLERHVGGNRNFHARRHFGARFYIAPVYSYRSHDGCFWLKRKALNTGSRYWWHRYNECRWG